MSTIPDKFTTRERADRLAYATGVFLEAEDLLAEQTYHRGRLARVLAYLHGWGTAAGLGVRWDVAKDEVHVSPGIAIDPLGRMIELSRPMCMSLDGWYTRMRDRALNPDGESPAPRFVESVVREGAVGAETVTLVADLYVTFAVCPRGRTPAFASGPYDAIDASIPERLRDGGRVDLVLRGAGAPLPADPWPARGEGEDLGAWRRRMEEAVLDAWRHGTGALGEEDAPADPSADGAPDRSSILLARLFVPADPTDGAMPRRLRTVGGFPAVRVDNHVRRFLYPSSALERWLDAVRGTLAP